MRDVKTEPAERLRQAWESYLPETRAAYARDLRQFLAWLDATPASPTTDPLALIASSAKRLTADNARAWMDSLLRGKWSKKTVQRKLTSLRAVASACVGAGLLDENPIQGRRFVVRMQEGKNPARRGPPWKDVQRLLRHVALGAQGGDFDRVRDAALVYLLVWSASRVSALCALTRRHWAEAQRCKSGARVLYVRVKGGREKPVTVAAPAVPWVEAFLRVAGREAARRKYGCRGPRTIRLPEDTPLLHSRDGRPLARYQVGRVVKRFTRALGFSAHPHAFRHAAATEALSRGASLEAVRQMLGHERTETTRIYDDAVREAGAWDVLR